MAVRALPLAFVFLLIEFHDELVYTVQGAALPVIRTEFSLSYAKIGLLLGLPGFVSLIIEPIIFLLGDTGLRKRLILLGGLAISASMLMIAGANGFPLLLAAAFISNPASGAFVSLSQATLMDLTPGREAQNMARWTVFGSLGNLLGPLLISAALALGLGWRDAFLVLAGLALVLVLLTALQRFPASEAVSGVEAGEGACLPWPQTARDLLRNLWQAVRNPRLLRWIFLLEFSDLLLDVFVDYLPLYLTDVTGFTPALAGVLLSVFLLSGLLADLLLIPLLERVPGRRVVRISAALALVAYPAFLLAPWLPVKIAILMALRFTTIGWYSVLAGEAYASIPGRSGTVTAAGSVGTILSSALIWLIGWIASLAGLQLAMWLLLLGPLALVLFVPKPVAAQGSS